jgi:hypothetical protein
MNDAFDGYDLESNNGAKAYSKFLATSMWPPPHTLLLPTFPFLHLRSFIENKRK